MILKRNLFLWRFEEYWFDEKAYLESKADIVALRIHTKISQFDGRMPEKTNVISLLKTEDEIEKGFSASIRYGIRQAQKTNTFFLAESEEDRNFFYQAYIPFAKANGLLIPNPSEEKDLEIFLAKDTAGNVVQGSAFLPLAKASVYRYRYGVSLKKTEANKAILLIAMRHAKVLGYEWFDLGGITTHVSPGSKAEGINFFKRAFGGKEIESQLYLKSNVWYFKIFLRFLERTGALAKLSGYLNLVARWSHKTN